MVDGKKSVSPSLVSNTPTPSGSPRRLRRTRAAGAARLRRGLGRRRVEDARQPIQNVSSRFGGMHARGVRAVGFNNIELITDRPLEVNFREIYETKKKYPKHAVIVSLMVETREEWKEIIKRSIDTGADGLELNFGCPHGMCERGMGSAVGQEPKVNQEITSLGRRVLDDARAREAHAQRLGHRPHGSPPSAAARTACPDQHHQEHHRRRHRRLRARAARGQASARTAATAAPP
jgi:hypothetical protein